MEMLLDPLEEEFDSLPTFIKECPVFCRNDRIVVLIHELGHVIMGKSFGCNIKEMQMFFLPFISYKHRQVAVGGEISNGA